jgi:hypothetical protein
MLCFIVLTDLCLDAATTTLFILIIQLHYFCPSGPHASAHSKSFAIEDLHNNILYRRFVDAGSFWEGERWVDTATPEFLCVNKVAALCCLMMLFGFVFSHFWYEVTRCMHRNVTFDSTACDMCHSTCNISRSCENVSTVTTTCIFHSLFFLLHSSTSVILTPILIQRRTEFVHWIITVLILM